MKNNPTEERYPAALTIAGSDSGGGAGIQADLRTMSAFGVYGCSAITALTSQNPRTVNRIDPVPAEGVACQIETVLAAIPVKFAKTGMLFNAEIVKKVAELTAKHNLSLVVDPVMVSTSGSVLLESAAVEAVKRDLFPRAKWITPNIPEAELLLGRKLDSVQDYRDAAKECFERWKVGVILKTGHAPGGKSVTDFICKEGQLYALSSPRAPERKQSHGTGCTLSAALTSALALGMPWKNALVEAKAFVFGSLTECVMLNNNLYAMYPPVEDYHTQVKLEKL